MTFAIRRGIALPAAIAAIVALSSLAALSALAARLAILESSVVADEARFDQARRVLDARLSRAVAVVPRAELLTPFPLGGADTSAVAETLQWPWHRLIVTADGQPVTVELAVANVQPLPWCEAVAAPDIANVQPGAVLRDPELTCDDAIRALTADSAALAIEGLHGELVLGDIADTVTVPLASVPRVWAAASYLAVPGGVSVQGLLVAPVVRVEAGARVRGAIIASQVVIVDAGALVEGDRLVLASALAAASRLTLLGARGRLHAR